MFLRQRQQRDVPEDPAAGIPSGVWAPVPDMDKKNVPVREQFPGQRNVKSGISVWMRGDQFAVEQDVAVHIYAVKAEDHDGIVAVRLPDDAAVPYVRRPVQVVLLSDQPVMRKIDRFIGCVFGVMKRAACWQHGKGPTVVQQRLHTYSCLLFSFQASVHQIPDHV